MSIDLFFTNLPSRATNPLVTQIVKLKPTDSVYFKTPFGETNIPEPNKKKDTIKIETNFHLPIIIPTIIHIPDHRFSCLLRVISSEYTTFGIEFICRFD
jgi:hypothetical protein